MKTVKVEKPDLIEGDWELDGYSFEIDDAVTGLARERISRRANAIYIKAINGVGIYEDEEAFELLAQQYSACVKHIGKVYRDGEELTEAERGRVLDSVGIVARDALSNEVAGANALGLKNVSG